MRHAEGEERRSKDHRYSLNNSDFSDIDDDDDEEEGRFSCSSTGYPVRKVGLKVNLSK